MNSDKFEKSAVNKETKQQDMIYFENLKKDVIKCVEEMNHNLSLKKRNEFKKTKKL